MYVYHVTTVIIYLNNFPIIYHRGHHATILKYYYTVTFDILRCDPGPGFQPIAEVHVFYVYVVLLFISAVLPGSWVIAHVAICPESMTKKNICTNRANSMLKWSFIV